MKLTELIAMLTEALEHNGDMDCVGIIDGHVAPVLDVNCPDEESPLYIEMYWE